MRNLIVGVLHRRGLHRFCRVRWVPMDMPSIRRDDGTVWKPDITGFGLSVHG